MFFSKEIGKRVLNIYYWEKLMFSKFVEKVNFSEKKIEEMHQFWRGKRYKVYLGKRLFYHYCLQLSFAYKTVSQNYFNLFYLGDKSPLLEFLGKWGWLPLKHSLLVIWHINAVRKTSIKKHEKSSRSRNFRQFRGFALDYESEESAETWENFVLFING